MRTFDIVRDPNDCGNLYYRSSVTFEPGLTVLVGCNGSGKTSLLRQINNHLGRNGTPHIFYNNLSDGGHNALKKASVYGDIEFMATAMCSSEGENIVLNLGNTARAMGKLVRENPDAKELWFLFDAIDSGLSVDNVIDLKEYLFKTVLQGATDKDVYIIVSANEYELCRGEKCFDTYLCKYTKFDTYEDYREFVIESRKRKEKREARGAKKE